MHFMEGRGFVLHAQRKNFGPFLSVHYLLFTGGNVTPTYKFLNPLSNYLDSYVEGHCSTTKLFVLSLSEVPTCKWCLLPLALPEY